MLLALGAMSAAAIGAGATSTFAWYQAVKGSYSVGANTTGSVTAKNPNITMGALQFAFTVKANAKASESLYLCQDNAGSTAAIYKYWDANHANLIPVTIADGDVGGYYTTVSVTLDSIKIDGAGADIKGTADTMKLYADTYAFKITASDDGYLSASEPDTSAKLGDVVGASGVQLITLDIIVSDAGAITYKVNNGSAKASIDSVYVALKGDDNANTGDGDADTDHTATDETSTLTVAKVE